MLRGDISQFDDVMAVMTSVKPDRVVSRHSAGVEGPITSERSASEPERSHVWPQAAEPTGPHREGEEPKPMMHGHEKSDSAIVAMKPPNKAGATGGGGGGAKGGGQGEREPMPHVPDTVPGKRVTGAGARTEGRPTAGGAQ